MSSLFISAAHKSSGKTTVSIGLCRALADRGQNVAPFKKGPDYIDPMWLSKASRKPCYNLDFNTMQHNEIMAVVQKHSGNTDITLIEGNKGLYDGLDIRGSNSNAALAKLLSSPVILVLDARGMTRGIAPLILGYQQFDPDVQIAGVILNQLGGSRHESKLRAVIEHYTDVSVLGGIHRHKDMEILERHLGLLPENETFQAENKITQIAEQVAEQVDLEQLEQLGQPVALEMELVQPVIIKSTALVQTSSNLQVGILQDSAFGFYYPRDLSVFKSLGVTLVPINALSTLSLPDNIDGLFIGGGFPETCMQDLENNVSLRRDIAEKIEQGLPTYAECGGMMYLSRSISWQGNSCEMVGIIKADTVMYEKPQGRGYVCLESQDNLWPDTMEKRQIAAHEFHYSGLSNLAEGYRFAYKVIRGQGIDGEHDGIIYKNMLACYSHLQDTEKHHWVERFVQFIENCKN